MSLLNILRQYKLIIWLAIFFLLAYFVFDGVRYLSIQKLTIHYKYLMISLLIALIAVLINAIKFRLLIEVYLRKKIPIFLWVKIFSISSLMNNVLPHGGTAYRAKFLKEYQEISYTEFIGVSYIFAFLGLVMILFLVSILFFSSFHDLYFLGVALFICIAIAVKVLLMHLVSKYSFNHERIDFYWRKLSVVFDMLLSEIKHPILPVVVLIFIFSAVVDYLVFYFLCAAIGIQENMQAVLLLYTLLSLSWLVRITPGNIGIQEFFAGLGSKIIGAGFVIGVALSIFLRLTYVVVNTALWLAAKILLKN